MEMARMRNIFYKFVEVPLFVFCSLASLRFSLAGKNESRVVRNATAADQLLIFASLDIRLRQGAFCDELIKSKIFTRPIRDIRMFAHRKNASTALKFHFNYLSISSSVSSKLAKF